MGRYWIIIFLPSEIIAAFLWSQLEQTESIISRRLGLWNIYHHAFAKYEKDGLVRRPVIPKECLHNDHLLLSNLEYRNIFIQDLKNKDIKPVFHYVPLDNSPGGQKFGRRQGEMKITYDISDRLVRMPLWLEIENKVDYIVEQTITLLNQWETTNATKQVASGKNFD